MSMRLRLHPDGARVLDEWRKHRNPPDEDQRLVGEVLTAVAEKRWQARWDAFSDTSDDSITILEPRPGLTVHIRLWTAEDPDQFALVRIIDEAPTPALGED
jgi:hypothetical protein